MCHRPCLASLSVVIALIASGCSSSRQRTDLGGSPSPPSPVYQQPVERPYQPAYQSYQRPPQPIARPLHPSVATGSRHTVQPGETLYGISRRYNVSVAGLIQANRLSSTAVHAGQVLIIPR